MTRRNTFGYTCYVILLLLQSLLSSVMAAEKDMFTYDYVDNDQKILKLRCHGDCSKESPTLVKVIIYNVTSMEVMAVSVSGTSPYVTKPLLPEISYYVGGCAPGEKSSCHLELLVTNVDILTHLNFGCNLTCSNTIGTFSTVSTSRVVDRKASREGSHKLSTTTLIILIVIIIVLFLLTVFFLSIWLRGWCRYRNKVLYQTPPQSEINHNQVMYGDSTSVLSLQKCPSKLSVRRATNGSIHRMTSRSETNITGQRVGYLPPLPPAPPPKMYTRNRPSYTQQTSACSTVKLSYAQPQDAIEPDFSEDGDVTSGNSDNQHGYPYHKQKNNPNTFYSSVPVNSVDV